MDTELCAVEVKEIETPLSAAQLFHLFSHKADTVFLDSAKPDGRLGRFSFIGLNAFLTFKSKGQDVWVNDQHRIHGQPFELLKEYVNQYPVSPHRELPFRAGAIGCISYDAGRLLEQLPGQAEDDLDFPDLFFRFYDNVLAIDHSSGRTYITALGILEAPEYSLTAIMETIKAEERPDERSGREQSCPVSADVRAEAPFRSKFTSNDTPESYRQKVGRIKQYIEAGDVYVMNLTQRLEVHIDQSPHAIYHKLREVNPAPFAAFLQVEDWAVLCASPERFLKVRDGEVQTRPIKGTRPRGRNEEEDERNRTELINSGKEKSELLMIVDLERNDLSKVCAPHTVKVTDLFALETYATVFHLVATVTGQLQSGQTAVDCLAACFPGGSITGAPKIRAMEIIDELEPVRRGLYTGSIGYLGFDGSCDMNMVIRTLMVKGEQGYIGAGGGITFESEEEAEYQETLDKAKALLQVIP